MTSGLVTRPPRDLTFCGQPFPRIIADAGTDAMRRFLEFFTANIRNANTRSAYARAVAQFCSWCDQNGLLLTNLEPIVIAASHAHRSSECWSLIRKSYVS